MTKITTKSDTLEEGTNTIDEKQEQYYTDMYKAGEVKEQLRIGHEVKGDTISNQIACIAKKSDAQSIPNNTSTQISWDVYTTSIESMALTDGIIIAPQAGYYLISVELDIQNGGTTPTLRRIQFQKNAGTTIGDFYKFYTGSDVYINAEKVVYLDKDDYVAVYLYQSSGGALNILNTSYVTQFSLVRL